MIESQTINELRSDPPTPTEIVQMAPVERNALLALSPEILNFAFKGFLTGKRLEMFHREKDWLPSADLTNAMLYAGNDDFNGLRQHTLDTIDQLHVELLNTDNTISTFPIKTDNIFRSLEIVERIVNKQLRRTGEPVVAHNFRCLLRTKQIINYYNELHNYYGSNSRHTPEIAEAEYISSNLHDFEEDPIIQADESIHIGRTKVIPNPDSKENNKILFLRRAMQNKRGYTSILEDMKLDLNPTQIHYIQNALRALNSSETEKDMIIEHLMGIVHEEYAAITLFDAESFVLSSIPIYIKTGADRPDNLATYFMNQNSSHQLVPVSPEKLINKAQENLFMFDLAEIHMLLDSPNLLASPLIYNSLEEVNSPSTLQFFPSRWAKLVLLGVSPNQMYTIPNEGGLPEVI